VRGNPVSPMDGGTEGGPARPHRQPMGNRIRRLEELVPVKGGRLGPAASQWRGAVTRLRSRLSRRALQLGALVVVLALWGAYLARVGGQLAGRPWTIDGRWLLAALAGWALYFLLLALGWVFLVRQTGQPLSAAVGVPIWVGTMPARYLPGNVWHVAGRLYLSSRLGLARRAVLLASTVEQVLTVLGAAAVGLLFGLEGLAPRWLAALALLGALGLVAIHPRALAFGWRLLERITGRPAPAVTLPYRGVALAWGWYGLTFLVNGLAFGCLAAALLGGQSADWPRLAGAYALAFVVGYLSLLTPAGLGTREAALVLLTTGLLPAPVALAASLLARAASAAAELLCVLVIGLAVAWRRRHRRAAPSTEPAT
jgi:uncharacterized membrane protein YbhN (UPF0104 family)